MNEKNIASSIEKETVTKLVVSFYGKENRMHFAKEVLRTLGKPKYICLKVNKDSSSFIVTPCEEKNVMSFRVPSNLFTRNGVKMRISSQGFVTYLLAKNKLDIEQTYRIEGIYLEKHNAVVFDMNKAVHFVGQEPELE